VSVPAARRSFRRTADEASRRAHGRQKEAVDLAESTVAWLQQAAPRAERLDPGLGDLGEVLDDHAHQDIRSAAAEA
jgi:hypothetical protein